MASLDALDNPDNPRNAADRGYPGDQPGAFGGPQPYPQNPWLSASPPAPPAGYPAAQPGPYPSGPNAQFGTNPPPNGAWPRYGEQQPYQHAGSGPQPPGPPPGVHYGEEYSPPVRGGYGESYPPADYSGPQGSAPLTPLPHDDFPPMPERAVPETADSLSPDMLLRGRRRPPSGGWRRAVYKATGGKVHPGESPGEVRERELVARARTPVAGGHHRVAVMSLKGGVGKTTTTVSLGSSLASLRGDRVIAVDANPDRGTLSDKVRLETAATVRDLLNERAQIQRYADVRAFTSQAPSRLEVLASDRDPAVSEAFSENDYRTVSRVLEHFYSICLTDCGTGLLHSAMAGVLNLADQIVLVSSPSVDGARSASATLDWLEAHNFGDLVRNAVVVLSIVRPRSKSTVDLGRLEEHFATRCRAVVRIPYDPHLEEGAEIDLERMSAATRDAYLQLSATVGDGFAWR